MACPILGFVLFAAFFVGLQIYQIISGVMIDRNFKPWIRRDKTPVLFWLCIAGQFAMILGGLIWMLAVTQRR